jgi:DNA-directed RNA polymerase sigma subunit (sigma70/sigma32)
MVHRSRDVAGTRKERDVNAAAKAAARRKRILRLRRRGDTFQEIGDALGVSRQRAHQLYKAAKR